MKTRQLTTDHRQRDEHKYGLRRGLGFWELTFAGQQAILKHELGTLYVACLLLDPPPEPIHAMALALKARKMSGQSTEEAEIIHERNLGLDDAEAVRNLRRKQRALETVLADELAIEPVKAEARREREEILEFLRNIGLIRRILVTPKNPRTDRQLVVRGLLVQQARGFDALTDTQQNAWNVAADGYQYRFGFITCGLVTPPPPRPSGPSSSGTCPSSSSSAASARTC